MQEEETSNEHENHRRFVERVVEKEEVWGLRTDEGWVICDSNEFEDRQVMPFWSDRASAQRVATDEWESCEPSSIPIEDFIELWLRGMDEDGVLVGTNWDDELNGNEIEPADLAEELFKRMEAAPGPQ